jgi:hypothetical protein
VSARPVALADGELPRGRSAAERPPRPHAAGNRLSLTSRLSRTQEVELLVMRNERLEWLIRNRPELTLELLKHLSDQIVSKDSDGGHSGSGPGDP